MSSLQPLSPHPDPARALPLRTSHVVGRSRECDLILADPRVSSHHARISWNGRSWEIRDLSSRNGCWVDGERAPGGTDVPLRDGATLGFGDAAPSYRLVVGEGPTAFAAAADGAARVGGADWLALGPEGAEGGPVVVRQGDGWLLEDGDRELPVADRQVVEVGGVRWTLALPGTPDATTVPAGAIRSLLDGVLELAVSSDEEHVFARFRHGAAVVDLGERSCLYLLATLARARDADLRAGMDERDAGWRERTELASGLRVAEPQVDLAVFRSRRLVEAAGIAEVHRLVERRRGRLRCGVAIRITAG